MRRKESMVNDVRMTTDSTVRVALRMRLQERYSGISHPVKIIEELGVRHGTARIDVAVVNGFMHGYEIKSDRDTLDRLYDQMQEYNAVFDKVTLVVGRSHVLHALAIIPEWWGVDVAVSDSDGTVTFRTIRASEQNPEQVGLSIARLLWREEALRILAEEKQEKGFRSKPRTAIYQRLATILDLDTLKQKVRETLLTTRQGWRSDAPLLSGGD